MFQLDVRDNIAEVLRRVEAREKSIPVAISNALNVTVFKVREMEVVEMKRVFDRPTRYTLNSLFIFRATAANPVARVFLKEMYLGPSSSKRHYLHPQIYGGGRPLKTFEYALRQHGFLPPGMFAVPGEAAKIDAYGNMSRGQIMQIMSALKAAENRAGYSANRTARSIKRRGRKLPQFFVGRPGGGRLPLGVWQSIRFGHGSAVKPVLIFVKQPVYQARFNFFDVAQRVASKAFPLYLERELRGIPTGASLGLS
jgi:hypothetical protein